MYRPVRVMYQHVHVYVTFGCPASVPRMGDVVLCSTHVATGIMTGGQGLFGAAA
jgi:hypothetical protein